MVIRFKSSVVCRCIATVIVEIDLRYVSGTPDDRMEISLTGVVCLTILTLPYRVP